jgi:hypothetical protein
VTQLFERESECQISFDKNSKKSLCQHYFANCQNSFLETWLITLPTKPSLKPYHFSVCSFIPKLSRNPPASLGFQKCQRYHAKMQNNFPLIFQSSLIISMKWFLMEEVIPNYTVHI